MSDQRQNIACKALPTRGAQLRRTVRSAMHNFTVQCRCTCQGLAKLRPQVLLPLTAERIQVEAGTLTLFIWILLGLAISGRDWHTQISDFLQFYVQGAVARQRNAWLLYDIAAQTAFAHRLVPSSKDLLSVPIVPPQVSLLFSAFAGMTYRHAELVWRLISAAGYALCCYVLWLACPNLRRYPIAVGLAAAAFPGLLMLILSGQTTVIALAAFTGGYWALCRRRPFAAGLAIGLLAYKPQLGLVAAGVFLLTRAWRVVAGALTTGLGQYAIACWWYRKAIVVDFLLRLPHLDPAIYEPRPYLMHSLRTFWRMLLPPTWAFPLYLTTALLVFVVCLRIWKSDHPLSLRFSGLLLATVLVDPHLYIYDLVVLAPVLLLLVDWRLGFKTANNGVFAALIYLTYGSTLLVKMFETNGVALASIAISLALFGFLYREVRQPFCEVLQ